MHHNFEEHDPKTIDVAFEGIVHYSSFGFAFLLVRRKVPTSTPKTLRHDDTVVFSFFVLFETKNLDFLRTPEVTKEKVIPLSQNVGQFDVPVRILKGVNLK